MMLEAHSNFIHDLLSFAANPLSNSMPNSFPTALCMTGFHSPDMDSVFKQVSQKLMESKHFVAVMESKQCSNLQKAVEKIIFKLLNSAPESVEEEEEIVEDDKEDQEMVSSHDLTQ
jgi:hypothetical protein